MHQNGKLLFITAFFSFMLLTGIFTSCENISISDSSSNTETPSKEKITVKISVKEFQDRTALPAINWPDFNFNLSAIQNYGEPAQKETETLFTNKSYTNLVQGIELEPAKYHFMLTAVKDGISSLSGVCDADLSQSGDTNLVFRMFPVTGGKGSASIKFIFPKDGPVASVKAAYTTEPFSMADAVDCPINIVSGEKVVTFNKADLPSGIEQYAEFRFYDSTGTLVYSGIESLVIVQGCVSSVTRNLTSDDWHTYGCVANLKKDGAGWASSGKSIKLVNKLDSSKVYTFKDTSNGVFTASVSEGEYYVYVNDENTYVSFNSVDKILNLNYWTVQLGTELAPVKSAVFHPVLGGIDRKETSTLVLGGTTFVYNISLASGYEESSSGSLVIKENEKTISEAAFDTDITISAISEIKTITVSGLRPVTYSISYIDDNGGAISSSAQAVNAFWASGYKAPSSFTVESPAELPGILDVKKNGGKFDSWIDNSDGETAVHSTEGIYKNLTLKATWKEFVQVSSSLKTIYANGFNLLICSEGGQTHIYADYDADGIVDDGIDEQVIDANNGNNADFTDYVLAAGNSDGTKVINSDFTFTMTGGKIAAIYGMDSKDVKRKNKSTLKISGNSIIGSAESPHPVVSQDKTATLTKSNNVKGVMLETITNEWVNIVGAMTGDYQVYCVTPYSFDKNKEHCIAYINQSTYADLKHFTCYTVDPELDDGIQDAYTKNTLAMKRVVENSVSRTLIRLSDNSGIDLPKPDKIEGEITAEFTLGQDCVTTECSVFSIRVSKGSFRVNDRLTITENTTDAEKAVEATLDYMCQPTPTTYETKLAYNTQYVYMQILSEGNQLTPEMASDFLRQVYFKRDNSDIPMEIKINLETIPSEEIKAAGVGYFDGSFYKKIEERPDHTKDRIFWTTAYNHAKAQRFNGLHGYLMTITSQVENNYIFKKLEIGDAWMGASRLAPYNGASYDEEVYPIDPATKVYDANYKNNAFLTGTTTFRWQCGPEAGLPFYETNEQYHANDKSNYQYKGEPSFFVWYEGEPNSAGTSGNMTGAVNEDGTKYNITDSREQCIQYKTNGTWNDLSITSKTPTGLIVEFTPYEEYWDGTPAGSKAQISNFTAITRTATY